MASPSGVQVNGIRGVTMTVYNAIGNSEILEPNTEMFTLLAAAINTGIKIVESDAGRQAFAASGRNVVEKWTRDGSTTFWGQTNQMANYVDIFLRRIRQDFPRVVVRSLSNPDEIAEYRRMPGAVADLAGNMNNYRPKTAGGILFNGSRVSAMVHAAAKTDKKHKERYLNFHFLFAVATAHELMHAFVALLARASSDPERYTPPETTHLNYGAPPSALYPLGAGESGRYMEKLLFGGSLEFYRDPKDDNEQVKCGIVHRLDDHAVAKRLSPLSCWKIVRHEEFTFPMTTEGSGITEQQRQQMNLRSLGSIHTHSTAVAGPSNSMKGKTEVWYNVSGTELEEVVTKHRRALSIHRIKVSH